MYPIWRVHELSPMLRVGITSFPNQFVILRLPETWIKLHELFGAILCFFFFFFLPLFSFGLLKRFPSYFNCLRDSPSVFYILGKPVL